MSISLSILLIQMDGQFLSAYFLWDFPKQFPFFFDKSGRQEQAFFACLDLRVFI